MYPGDAPTLAVLMRCNTRSVRLSLRHLVKETQRPDDSLQTLQQPGRGDRERIVRQCCRDLNCSNSCAMLPLTVFYHDRAGVRTVLPVTGNGYSMMDNQDNQQLVRSSGISPVCSSYREMIRSAFAPIGVQPRRSRR
jgi:hypothetical protein